MKSCYVTIAHHRFVIQSFTLELALRSQRIGLWKLDHFDSQIGVLSEDLKKSASEQLITQFREKNQQAAADDISKSSAKTWLRPKNESPDTKANVTRPKLSMTDYATPTSSVSAFCRAVLRSLIPLQFYGNRQHKITHQMVVFRHVDRFVRMRRFESLSVHEVCKGIKVRIDHIQPRMDC
ncbi:telomerase reverse transcriptase [Aspergillus alliaceus]|uniref:telomerase reverse transcriptase n=1 Tax=Petromyces alliaceus TaxID=209559 RepID=UPI0012A3F3FE|nr:uncharacterized protein BDW43DRAFT_121343 [Aspergillus alliaceus]KAB8238671.1 hypothetical protein BDW43DRAFT_121343 [Aspergillus alliaceus]